MITRTFLPVGQGAFYCEQFTDRWNEGEKINVVYDCGCLPNKKRVEDVIKQTFEEGETIHAVFISHLDEDHVNGVPYLLERCNVKNIFFPLLTQEYRTYLRLDCAIHNKNVFLRRFIMSPEDAVREYVSENVPSIYGVMEYQNSDDVRDSGESTVQAKDDEQRTVRAGDDVSDIIFQYNKYSKESNGDWVFIPFNFRQDKRVNELKAELRSIFKRDVSCNDLVSIWSEGTGADREKIKQAYKAVKGSLNTNSMTLFSGTKDPRIIQYKSTCKHCIDQACYCIPKGAGCLYTGDYDASGLFKWDQLKTSYKDYWQHIGCVQIPHHGSKHNYNPELAEIDAYMVMSAGEVKKYRHPHYAVLKDLILNGRFPNIVTGDDKTKLQFIINKWGII